jgi:hypothetical protein
MNSFRPDKVYNLEADREKYILKDVFNFLLWEQLRAGEGRQQEVGTNGWAPKLICRRIQQTDGIRPNGIGEGGPGQGNYKHSKKSTGYMNQVIIMQRWMIKKV